ncbi:hypothetical protein FIBSPDRAFT_921425 [Athelia psychrophila]|uniref:Mitochondrial DNA polymerase catalytic subunit n=1 Tax=Athelia psychrophila TaxID=1759441 RepID=A0A166CZL2_9AGAM|nr:hypothetical protein FIBSPDRAFT_921425 [Fibularhizoctonia sp. CBS 109695]
MLRPIQQSSRGLHASASACALKQLTLPPGPRLKSKQDDKQEGPSTRREEKPPAQHIKRNELGVQMLARPLHAQLFADVAFPAPNPAFTHIAREHLKMHGLDLVHGSVLPDTAFTLPPLHGRTLDEHFHAIGAAAAEPYRALAAAFAGAPLPPRPEHWAVQSGWTRYTHVAGGGSFHESVAGLDAREGAVCFDVETMPNEGHAYAVLATAATADAWYAWISPWLLGESDDPAHLIPLDAPGTDGDSGMDGDSDNGAGMGMGKGKGPARVVVGHNVSYDRARIRDEYALAGSATRFVDTMALHIAVKGISSHQRPAWMKHRKGKEQAAQRHEEAVAAIESRWEDITSVNSLAAVAKLHCGIALDKTARSDFMSATPAQVRGDVRAYLDYCAGDVHATHRVLAAVLPQFLARCPSPVSFAGMLSMGSSFLCVDEGWEGYLADAERTYRDLDRGVKARLLELAEAARERGEGASRGDPWLSQLDWTPKAVRKVHSDDSSAATDTTVPAWYNALALDPVAKNSRILPHLLRIAISGHPVAYDTTRGWHALAPAGPQLLPTAKGTTKVLSMLSKSHGLPMADSGVLRSGDQSEGIVKRVMQLAEETAKQGCSAQDPWLSALDWTAVPAAATHDPLSAQPPAKKSRAKAGAEQKALVPKWYWDLSKPKKGVPAGAVDITVRTRVAPLLLRLSWLGWPLVHSREHGWAFRVAPATAAAPHAFATRLAPLAFYDPADDALRESGLRDGHVFYKLPHKDGAAANVGNPLAKPFMKFAQDGTLTSPEAAAAEALDMNAQCSYWISSRDRIMNQNVVWQDKQLRMGFADVEGKKRGVIIPQVIAMGTVTRRAIERTWLTASNAKANRVGSELKAMVRAPAGYAIVGADVDSEELWIASCMGDAQFGLHGATAIGWMTLEGTKAAGTDLHSKTAGILGISRDQAKVFNYSRIYGAGMKHAMQLLVQSNAGMLPEVAQQLAQNLYASTKGKTTHRTDVFGRKFWFGGTESYLFNKLEEIALSDKPETPALGCGVTDALSKKFLPEEFGSNYMTSRINWVVQSSGVDYLHLLIVSMDHLIAKYNINARYLISVHDELRYLVTESDKYRLALALQIANIWTRSLFAYKLGMDDLPQGVAFFSAVDVDTVLRKEVDMPCVTPSQPHPIPAGESINIAQTLQRTHGGSLHADGTPMVEARWTGGPPQGYQKPDCMKHRSQGAAFLQAQATTDFAEIKHLAQREAGVKYDGGIGGPRKSYRKQNFVPASLANIAGVEWDLVNEVLKSNKLLTVGH